MDTNRAREIRSATEAFHAFVYFSKEVLESYQKVGITHPRMAYFAPRAAAMGAVSAGVVSASFYNFNPVKVAEHIPAAWEIVTPKDLVSHRLTAVGEHLPAALGAANDPTAIEEALELARWAVESCTFEGRVLAGAHAEVQPPEDHLGALWHYVSVLREHRGDGHLMALQAHELDSMECLIFRRPDTTTSEYYRKSRGWGEQEWAQARERLSVRGLIQGEAVTAKGHEVKESVETMTDQLSIGPWAKLGEEEVGRFQALMAPMSDAAKRVLDASPIGAAMLKR